MIWDIALIVTLLVVVFGPLVSPLVSLAEARRMSARDYVGLALVVVGGTPSSPWGWRSGS
jgi:hypothetical protein